MSWLKNTIFGEKIHVPTMANIAEHNLASNRVNKPPVVLLKTRADLNTILKKMGTTDIYKFGARGFLASPSLALNLLLYYISARSQQDQKKYKLATKVIIDVITFCHFNKTPSDQQYTRLAIGSHIQGYYYYITLINDVDSPILTLGMTMEHYDFRKTASQCFRDCTKRNEDAMMNINSRTLEAAQKRLLPAVEQYMGDGEYVKQLLEVSSYDDISFSEEVDVTVAAPASVINKRKTTETPLPLPQSKRDEVSVRNNTNNDNALNASDVVNIDETLMDPELKEALNENPVVTAMLEPKPKESNVEVMPQKVLVEAESEVLKEVVKKILKVHYSKLNEGDYMYNKYFDAEKDDDDTPLNTSTMKKLDREEARYLARKRSGRLHTGPHTLASGRIDYDFRGQTHDAAGRQIDPNRSYKLQDDDYLDYAFYGFCREYGTMVNDIMKLPLGLEFNSQRRGSTVNVKALHFRNTFTHVTGTKASGRMILFYSELPFTHTTLGYRQWNEIKTEDVLQKSVTMYAGDLEELEAADVFYNPTIMSQYDFKNVILGRKFQVLYDYYVDLNTQAVKGIVGEDVESVDSIKTKWVKIDDLDLPFFYEDNDDKPLRGVIGVLFMGDYFGGEIETNMTLRVFYNSR